MKKHILLFAIIIQHYAFSNVVVPPIANSIGNQAICDEGPLMDGVAFFDLTSYNVSLLAGNQAPLSNYAVTFYLSQNDALNNANSIVNPSAYSGTNGQTIWVRVTDTTTTEYALTSFGLVVNVPPVINTLFNSFSDCDLNDGLNDGYSVYNLNLMIPQILNGLPASNHTVVFYPTLSDAFFNSNAISNPTNYVASTGSIYFKCSNNTTGCASISAIDIVVEQLPEPLIMNDPSLNLICVDYSSGEVVGLLLLESANLTIPYLNEPIVARPTYTYQWYENGVAIPGADSPTYLIDTPLSDSFSSVFSVEMQSTSANACSSVSQDFIILQSGQASPVGIGYSIVNDAGNQVISVEIQGYGIYQYSLDGGSQQDSPVFENVTIGSHSITVWDIKGGLNSSCSPLVLNNVEVIAAPTPPPTGNSTQSFGPGATLAAVQVEGQNIRWYSTDSVATSSVPFPLDTVLVNGTTYYASQKIGGYESVARLAVNVQIVLSNQEFQNKLYSVYPNPFADVVHVYGTESILSVKIYNLLGQLIYDQRVNDAELQLNLQELTHGNYIAKIQIGSTTETIKLVKN